MNIIYKLLRKLQPLLIRKILIWGIFLIMSIKGDSQINGLQGYNYKREVLKFNKSYQVTKTLRDSTSKKPFISNIKFYNENGLDSLELDFNNLGDTIETLFTYHPNNLMEVLVYHSMKSEIDSAFINYNESGYMIKEYWFWGDEKERDTSYYFYDKGNKLLKEETYYNFGSFRDTFIYENERIKNILCYDNKYGLQDSLIFKYQKTNLIESRKYQKNKLISVKKFKYKRKQLIKIWDNYRYLGNSKEKRKRVEKIRYYSNGKIKFKKIKRYENERLIEVSRLKYSILGFVEKSIIKDKKKKTKRIQITVLYPGNNYFLGD